MPVTNAEKEEKKEQWVVDIETKYGSYDPEEYDKEKNRKSIYRWPNDLVAVSSLLHHRAPATVSLGPYHHGDEHVQPMERHKERALYRILRRSNVPLTTFVQSLQDVEQKLWDSYDNLDPKLSRHLFLRMMLFDGCFLLELLRFPDDSPDPFFGSDQESLVSKIEDDMLKLENQIPLLVLEKLLEVEEGNNPNNHTDLNLLVSKLFFGYDCRIDRPYLHILDICWQCVIEVWEEEKTPSSVCSCFQSCLHLSGKGLKCMVQAIPICLFWLLRGRTPEREHFRTASSLHKAGIKFKEGEPGVTISFDEKNGVLTLPKFHLHDILALLYVNLIAFERLHPPLSGHKWMTNYMFVMDKLIDTAEDVGVLASQGVLKNHLASDEDAAKVINAFSDSVFGDPDKDVITKWQKYAASDWNLALASLKQNYFQNPWSLISFFAALILLVSTIISTVFSGMQVLNGPK